MCGISGLLEKSCHKKYNYESILVDMGNLMKKRGPDSSGIWFDSSNCIGLSHRRLSILDLSSAGHQPMASFSGNYTICFNGEIYNHLALRKKIFEEYHFSDWKSTSDTETLLACFEFWGIKETLCLLEGMFAIAVWDRSSRKLYLARDRSGEKPLYFGIHDDCFLFSSQLNVFKAYPGFKQVISNSSLQQYLKFGYIPQPNSIFENTFKLLPGHLLAFDLSSFNYVVEPFWDFKELVASHHNKYSKSYKNAIVDLDNILNESVTNQMISDVPLGAFLSGGIDSSLITSIMQSNFIGKVNTFTIGFNEENFNEATFAKDISNYLKTNHHELYVNETDALDLILDIPEIYDEPFSDPSLIPTYILAKMTKEKVTVSLSGDGGDELFCGYNRYLSTNKYWKFISLFPTNFRRFISSEISKLDYSSVENKLDYQFTYLRKKSFTKKLFKLSELITSNSPTELYSRFINSFNDVNSILLNSPMINSNLPFEMVDLEFLDDIEKFMYYDFISYLPDDILVKLDRASMGVSLESRAPFLSKNVIEFAWSLPLEYKINNGNGKLILKDLLKTYIPENLFNRPKMGFGIPLASWLRGELSNVVNEVFDSKFLEQQNIFNVSIVSSLWKEHLTGRSDNSKIIWNLFIFQLWYNENINGK